MLVLAGSDVSDITVQNQCPLDRAGHLEIAYAPMAGRMARRGYAGPDGAASGTPPGAGRPGVGYAGRGRSRYATP